MRNFALTNLQTGGLTATHHTRLHWRCNLPALYRSLDVFTGFPFEDARASEELNTLVLYGTRARYVTKEGIAAFEHKFPRNIVVPLDTSHWVHAEQPRQVVTLLSDFLA